MRIFLRLLALSPTLLAAACATDGSSAALHPAAPASATASRPSEDDLKFSAFIHDFRTTALASGIQAETYDRSMSGIARNSRVQDLNLRQPEFAKPVWEYLDGAISPLRMSDGQTKLADNATMLANLESLYGVPKQILVAIWGIETNYGAQMGSFNMFEALATLGYDGPRTELGRRELIAAMRLEGAEHLDPRTMTSSWAGAFGETQFMPSTFLRHAVDADGDGRKDLWHSPADALASTAAMLREDGWQPGKTWGYEVRLPANFPYAEADADNIEPLDHWRALGVKTAFGEDLPAGSDGGAIFLPTGAHGPAFLVFTNFKVILRYNNATSYALAVAILADRIVGKAGVLAAWPREEPPLSRDDRMAFQRDLQQLGFDPGAIDGLLGPKVRKALRAYQSARGLVPDGFATQELLQRMEREIAAKAE